jgi:transcriptional regulator with AAA-type ATPase domain
MSERIRFADLPSRLGGAGSSQWVLTWQAGERAATLNLPEGESVVGSSARSCLRLNAPGVAARHLRIRRGADGIFVQPLGRAGVRVAGAFIRNLTPLGTGQELAFGEVVATIERIEPEDEEPAVRIAPAAAPVASGECPSDEPQAWQLNRLTEVAEEGIRSPAAALDRLVHLLRHLAEAQAAALCSSPAGRAREWAILAEAREADDPPLGEGGGQGCARFVADTGGSQLAVLVRFADQSPDPWRSALCRHTLALAALIRRPPERRQKPGAETEAGGDPWAELAGDRIRKHLDGRSGFCRFCDTVLVLGETGTGKELVARGLHKLWKRSGALVGINCAAVPADLLDAELFGIEGGTATGVSARRGRIDQAAGGTLFLDEVADLPITLQTKLLRVLQEREYYSVGGSVLRRADAHIVAASNRTAEELRGGHMRADLYFRLSQGTIQLPPLRERLEDLPALCAQFLAQMEQRFSRGVEGLSVSALEALRGHSWQGNIRELHNVLRILYASTPPGRVIGGPQVVRELREDLRVPQGAGGKLASLVEDVERRSILVELERSGSVPAAARALGLSEGYLYRKLKKLGIPKDR